MLIKSWLTSFAVLLGLSQAAQADILVGFVTGLSGPVSSIGIPNAKGIAAGQAYVGEIGGEKVRVIQLDDGSDPTASTRNARKLAEQDKVDILIGTSGAPQTLAMATAAIEMKVPMIAVSPIAPVPSGDGGPWVVQTPQPTPLLVQGIVDHMKARGLKSVAFIGFSDAFGDLMYESLSASAKAADIKVVANERYARSDSSVTAQLLRALAARPDAIMLGGTGTPGALPVIGLSERGYKGPLYGNHGLISADFLRLAGKAANGIICPTGPVTAAEQLAAGNPIREVALAFRAAFAKANGEAPTDSFSSYSFDGWLVFVDAAKRALATGAKPGSPEFRSALREALFTTKDVVGTQGVYTFTPADRHGVDARARIMVQIEDGHYKLLP
ncbi:MULTISPECIES: ABC transporter substrate-binding protein [Bradyrhizobium]|jgi:branched-chain amino acid transport system substrate-binding protein|uniref:ABC transporter substrate-binding protein n=5 Tax=Bradyrhizobium TaxID=374 RepID=A0ABS5GE77_9BRAD|nr:MULTISPECIES: ABC transporter substrate-binding protein [Bradyrhizobium]RTM00766.1 MAG: ABC transporter substrate-binding protein [Bradyrhizobiaceae bacterium]ABQ35363.1 amino acid/amide ABC transporter substrate-binding protein, HAAT family [Bradyrhizobium sp. BTAi1]MBR1139406.1 ABC transporter substrate-binding protein [Bradyrhizobium denitrificans]MCL8484614.1 ABC transporter substrate-binding protein [Bradyrhizobium denitrificans]MDU0953866.1 ABC transporter substrate-binding protein [B